jgi:phosphoglycolate phosphatase-like HAD superfamily hydrolase
MLYIFDVDGTIAMSYEDKLLPEAAKFFETFDWTNDRMALVTNQGGVGLRYWLESGQFGEPEKYPTKETAWNRLHILREQIVGEHVDRCPIFACFAYQSKSSGKWGPTPFDTWDYTPNEWSQYWRKPSPGMLLAALDYYMASSEDTVFIGNSDEDKQAAEAAGIRFVDEHEFLKPHYVFTYRPDILVDWLTDEQRVGLDMAATTKRFRYLVNKSLNGSSEHRDVTEFIEDNDLELGYMVEPDELGQHDRWIGDIFINCDWLVYESAEAHAKAMANALNQSAVNHAVVLPVILSTVYGIGGKEAYALVEKYKDKAKWDRTRFVLGSF